MGRNQFIAHKAAGLIEFAYFPVLSISREWIKTNSTVYKKAAGAIFEKKSSQTICRMFGLSKCRQCEIGSATFAKVPSKRDF